MTRQSYSLSTTCLLLFEVTKLWKLLLEHDCILTVQHVTSAANPADELSRSLPLNVEKLSIAIKKSTQVQRDDRDFGNKLIGVPNRQGLRHHTGDVMDADYELMNDFTDESA